MRSAEALVTKTADHLLRQAQLFFTMEMEQEDGVLEDNEKLLRKNMHEAIADTLMVIK